MTHAFHDERQHWHHWMRLVSRRRWLVLRVTAASAMICAIGVANLPDRYEASARIYVDTQTVLKPLMANLAYQPDIDQQVGMLARTLISRPNMERLVRRPELQFGERSVQQTDALVSGLMKQIRITPVPMGPSNLYDITYRGNSPEGARQLVAATLELFVQTSSVAKQRDSQDAGRFIDAQIQTYEAKLGEVEERRRQFKASHAELAGPGPQEYFSRVLSLTEQINRLDAEMGAAIHSRDAYRSELGLSASDAASGSDTSGVISEIEQRIADQRKLQDEQLSRYTEQHPDVVATRHVIAQLEVQASEARRQPAGAIARRSGGSAAGQQLRIALAEAEARVTSLQSQRAAQQAQLETLRAQAARMPQIEAEQAQIERDYQVVRTSYDSMLARRESANLGLKLDQSAQLTEFRVVEPPRVAPTAVFPTQLHLAALGVLVSVLLGLAVAAGVERLMPTLVEPSQLRRISGRPVLGAISVLTTGPQRAVAQAQDRRFSLSLGALVLLQLLWIGWIAAQPLT